MADGEPNIKDRAIQDELKGSYLDYAMSVIVGRALPDVRDGFKPVHRRVLHAMNELGNHSNKPYKKSARIVGECFVKDTLVLTARGLLPIQDVAIGDEVFTHNRKRRVNVLFEMPEKALVSVKLENGTCNTVTPSQKFLVLKNGREFEWKEARELSETDYAVIRSAYPEPPQVRLPDFAGKRIFLTPRIAYLLGQLISDGWVEKGSGRHATRRRLFFFSSSKAVVERCASILKEEFGYTAKVENKPYELRATGGKVSKKRAYQIRINSDALNDYLVGVFELAGAKAVTKTVPAQFLVSPREVIYAFISGLVDGDGSIHRERNMIHYGSVSSCLITKLQLLLQHLGVLSTRMIDSNLEARVINGRKSQGRFAFHYLEIRGRFAQELASNLDLADEDKASRALELPNGLVKQVAYDRIPCAANAIFSELSERHIGSGWYLDSQGKKFRMGIKYPSGSKIRYSRDLNETQLTRNQIKDWGIHEKLERLGSPSAGFVNEIMSNGLRFIRVSGVEPAPPEKTYDIQVESDHCFVANGMISHNCLGKYHPHGDTAVYDTIVRMAQDFSLRYPLVDGQGNFGCFTKDTEVKLADGRSVSFGDLIREHEAGKKNFTYTVDANGKVKVAEIKNPRMTRANANLVKVTLDNGGAVRCTPNHPFMLKDGTYCEADRLAPGSALMPVYTRLSETSDALRPKLEGYEMIYEARADKWVACHILADEWNIEHGVYARSAGRIRHHRNFNKLDNSPENIVRLNWAEHWKAHYTFTSARHAGDPEYVKKLAAGRARYWSDSKVREAYSARLSAKNVNNWKNPSYRKKMRVFLSRVNKEHIANHPEKRVEFSKRASATLKRLWATPEYRMIFHNKIVAVNKSRKTNNTGRTKFLKICSLALERFKQLSQETYESARGQLYPYGMATTWRVGVEKYFQSKPDLILQALNGNHKVVSVEPLSYREDVYDLTIDGTHNFALASGVFVHNSVDGDSAAAMRYTEIRLAKAAEDMLADIEKETVDFVPNFDGSLEEPTVLPSALPNLLVNGSSGIAVGMATNIPPHNLCEVCDAIFHFIDNPDATVPDLMNFVKGPDFPTGGIICGRAGIFSAYTGGKGAVTVRAKAEVKEAKDRKRIIVTEIPFMVNKARLVEQIADLVNAKKIEGISDLRDESDKEGMRVVIELKRDANPEIVLNQLYEHTPMQSTFGIINLALSRGETKVMGLRDMISYYVEHRREVVTRRSQFELRKAEDRAHILEGLIIALANIDAIIAIAKAAKDPATAATQMIARFDLSEKQAQAILDMKIQRLTGLEREKIDAEHSELLKRIKELKRILSDVKLVLRIVKSELAVIREKYGDARRTEITDTSVDIMVEDLIPHSQMVVTITKNGYIKRIPLSEYEIQRRGGRGLIGVEAKESDYATGLLIADTHDYLLFFTDKGRVHWLKVYTIPESGRYSAGKALVNLMPLEGEKVQSFMQVSKFSEDESLVFCTKNGLAKKTPLSDYSNPRRGGIIAINLREGDELISVKKTDGKKSLIIATKHGMSVRFGEDDVRDTGRASMGVIGIRLREGDEVIGMEIAEEGKDILTICENGHGKRTPVTEYRVQNRGGYGVITIQTSERNGSVVAISTVTDDDELMLVSSEGIIIRVPAREIRVTGRNAQGVRIMRLTGKAKVVAMDRIAKEAQVPGAQVPQKGDSPAPSQQAA